MKDTRSLTAAGRTAPVTAGGATGPDAHTRPLTAPVLRDRAAAPSALAPSRRGMLLGALGLVAAGPLAFTAPAPARAETEPPSDPKLEQTVSESEEIIRGEKVVIGAGHVDIGPRLINDDWLVAARDDTANPPVWRSLDDVVLQVHDAGALNLPDDPAYAFTGVEPGAKVWSVPQTEIPGVVWVGWNTQDPPVVQTASRGVTLRVHGAQGPGKLSLFLQPGNFEPPQVLVDPAVAEPQDVFVEPNTHTHANWVFTAPGIYLVDLEILAETPDGKKYSASATVRYAVGDATDTEAARTEAWAAGAGPEARAQKGAADAASDDSGSADSTAGAEKGAEDGSGGTLLFGGGIAAAFAAVAAGVIAAQRRRAKAAREAAWADEDGVRRSVARSGELPVVDPDGARADRAGDADGARGAAGSHGAGGAAGSSRAADDAGTGARGAARTDAAPDEDAR